MFPVRCLLVLLLFGECVASGDGSDTVSAPAKAVPDKRQVLSHDADVALVQTGVKAFRWEKPAKNASRLEKPAKNASRLEEPAKNTSRREKPFKNASRLGKRAKNSRREKPSKNASRLGKRAKNTSRREKPSKNASRPEKPAKNTSRREKPSRNTSRPEKPAKNSSNDSVPVGFPLVVPGHMHYVASVAVSIAFAGIKVHAYDIGLYLRSNSKLWGRKLKDKVHEAEIEAMIGESQIHFHFSTKWVSRGAMATFVDFLYPICKKAKVDNYDKALEVYKHKLLHGPKVSLGSTLVIEPKKTGIHLLVNGQDLGMVMNSQLGNVTLNSYLNLDTVLPTFRKEVFAQLQAGLFSVVHDGPTPEEVDLGRPWWFWLVIALAIVAATVSLALLTWCCCCRRKASAKAPLADGEGKSSS